MPRRELGGELGLDQELVGAAAEDRELVLDVDGHGCGAAFLSGVAGGVATDVRMPPARAKMAAPGVPGGIC